MKQYLQISAIILTFLITLTGFSQTYQVDEKRIYSWDNFAAEWVLDITEQNTYANGGNKETKIVATSVLTTQQIYQHFKTYNTNNNIILDLRQDWDGAQWVDDSQDTYTYYAGTSNVKDVTTYNFSQGHDTFKVLYEYSGNDIIKITFQDGSSGSLINYRQYDYTYTIPGQPYQEFESNWSGSSWVLDERATATYTPGLRELIVEEYNGSTYDLFERYLTYYTISLQKDDEYIQQSWNGSSYVNSDRELSEYDGDDNKTKYTWYSWLGGAWEPYYKEEKDFSVAAPLSTESFENDNFKVFPNPASSVINIVSKIAIDKVELYNILGKKVMQSSNNKPLNVESLNAGIYVLKVFNNNKSATKKIVIN